MKIIRLLLLGCMSILSVLLVGALALHLTVRDSVDALAAIFYATPWPVMTVLALLCTVYWLIRRPLWVGLIFLVITLGCATPWVRSYRREPVAKTPDGVLHFSYWNAARPTTRLNEVIDRALESQPDALAIGERQPSGGTLDPTWTRRLFPRRVLPLNRGMLLAAFKGVMLEEGTLHGGGRYSVCRFSHGDKEIYVLMVDLSSSVTKSRQPAFTRLYALIEQYADKLLIVAGDFNTPAESVYFDPVREKLKDAFETAGQGSAYTWPYPLPVLSLDHVWLGKGLRAVNCRHEGSALSDHQMVVTEIVVE